VATSVVVAEAFLIQEKLACAQVLGEVMFTPL
jgi:hypothetical protein